MQTTIFAYIRGKSENALQFSHGSLADKRYSNASKIVYILNFELDIINKYSSAMYCTIALSQYPTMYNCHKLIIGMTNVLLYVFLKKLIVLQHLSRCASFLNQYRGPNNNHYPQLQIGHTFQSLQPF